MRQPPMKPHGRSSSSCTLRAASCSATCTRLTTTLFAANNRFAAKANQCLSASKHPYEFGVVPDPRFQQYVRSQVRETLRRHVVKYDISHRM